MRYQVPIQYSIDYGQPFFQYRDETGRRHIVWYEDSRARVRKLQLMIDYRLRGPGAWQLGLHFPLWFHLMVKYGKFAESY